MMVVMGTIVVMVVTTTSVMVVAGFSRRSAAIVSLAGRGARERPGFGRWMRVGRVMRRDVMWRRERRAGHYLMTAAGYWSAACSATLKATGEYRH